MLPAAAGGCNVDLCTVSSVSLSAYPVKYRKNGIRARANGYSFAWVPGLRAPSLLQGRSPLPGGGAESLAK